MSKNRLHNLYLQSLSCLAFFLLQTNFSLANISISNVANATPGNCDGAIEVEATGTANPFTILVSDGDFVYKKINIDGSAIFENLCAGMYTITVINEQLCETELNAEILECNPDGFNIGFTQLNEPNSCLEDDGGIRILGGVSGGTEPYQYEWNNGMIGSQISGLSGGTYTVTITDAVGCTDEETYELQSVGVPVIVYDELLNSCEGLNNGIIDVFAYDPTPASYPPFTYLWSTGVTSNVINQLSPGTYTVTATNQTSGCTATETFVIESEPINGDLTVEANITTSCPNKNQGSILLSVSGGNPPYTYDWDTSFPTSGIIILNKPQGTYCTTVTDHCGASFSECYEITGPPSMVPTSIQTEWSCPQRNEGSITIEFEGGQSPFTLTAENNHGLNIIATAHAAPSNTYTVQFENLSPGIYTITIEDDCGQTIEIPEITVEAYPTYPVQNATTCTTDFYCSSTNEYIYSWGSLGYTYVSHPLANENNCIFYQVCNTPEATNNPSVYGNLVPGSVVQTGITTYSGGMCQRQRVCTSPSGNISFPFSSTSFLPQSKFDVEIGNGQCVDQLLCDGMVVWQSFPPHTCIRAIADSETRELSIDGSDAKSEHSLDNLDNEDSLVNMFPNPFDDKINVVFHSTKNQNTKVRILNSLGQEVWNNNQNLLYKGRNVFSVDIGFNLPSGLYIFELVTVDGKRFTKSLVH